LVCALGRSCELVIQPHGRPLPVAADRLALQRILLNLATNAHQAMPGGGKVTIEAYPAEGAQARTRVELPAWG
jgi:signal transduction histidine kinase